MSSFKAGRIKRHPFQAMTTAQLSTLQIRLAQAGASDSLLQPLLITAFGSPEVHREADRLGAAMVLDKPFRFDALREIVQNIMSHRTR